MNVTSLKWNAKTSIFILLTLSITSIWLLQVSQGHLSVFPKFIILSVQYSNPIQMPPPSTDPPLLQLQLLGIKPTCLSHRLENVIINKTLSRRARFGQLVSYETLEYAKTFCELDPKCSGISRFIFINERNNRSNFRYSLRNDTELIPLLNATTWFKTPCYGNETSLEQKSILPQSPVVGLRGSSLEGDYYQTNFTCKKKVAFDPIRNPIKQIYILGERNSGTNLLTSILKSNTNISILHDLKHTRLDRQNYTGNESTTLYIHLSKDIFSWLRSMHRIPYHFIALARFTFEAFLLTPWNSSELPYKKEYPWVADDGFYDNILQLRAIKLQSFLTIQSCLPYTLQLRYQDLAKDSLPILELIKTKFNIKVRDDLNTSTCFWKHGLCMKGMKEKDIQEKHRYYEERLYLNEFSENAFKIVSRHIDFDLESQFGYDYSDIDRRGFLDDEMPAEEGGTALGGPGPF